MTEEKMIEEILMNLIQKVSREGDTHDIMGSEEFNDSDDYTVLQRNYR